MADRSDDSGVDSEDHLRCENCGKGYEIEITNTVGGAILSANQGSDIINHGYPYLEEEGNYPEWHWKNDVAVHRKILEDHLGSASELLEIPADARTKFSLHVMLYGHIVAAIEGFLSSVFIKTTLDNNELIRRLIETDPKFADMKFTMSQIFQEQEQIKNTVSIHLQEIIFHDLKKIKPMYKSVLGHEFGDISWLFQAVINRHHCVHRAGYDKQGNSLKIEKEDISELIIKIRSLANDVINTTRRLIYEFEPPF